jgi:hypothetical protein
MADKKAFHQHEHPIYPWIALFFSLFMILGVAGWYYLTYLDTLNAETDSSVSSAYTTTVHGSNTVSGTNTTTGNVDQQSIDQAITAVDKSMKSTNSNDFSDSNLSNSTVGVSN